MRTDSRTNSSLVKNTSHQLGNFGDTSGISISRKQGIVLAVNRVLGHANGLIARMQIANQPDEVWFYLELGNRKQSIEALLLQLFSVRAVEDIKGKAVTLEFIEWGGRERDRHPELGALILGDWWLVLKEKAFPWKIARTQITKTSALLDTYYVYLDHPWQFRISHRGAAAEDVMYRALQRAIGSVEPGTAVDVLISPWGASMAIREPGNRVWLRSFSYAP